MTNNTLHSLFSDCTVSANGLKISNANGHYAHKSFLETEFSHNIDAKKTWLACQGYQFEKNPNTLPAATERARREACHNSAELHYYGRVAVDFFTCDRQLLNGVTLRIAFRRSPDDFIVYSDDATKHYKVQIIEANLYVRKMTVNDNIIGSIERTLMKSPAIYPYF